MSVKNQPLSKADIEAMTMIVNAVRTERIRAIRFCEMERRKILRTKEDPSWTEHLANVQNDIAGDMLELIPEAHKELSW